MTPWEDYLDWQLEDLAAAHNIPFDADELLELDDAVRLRDAGYSQRILLLEGFFSTDELPEIAHHRFAIMVHAHEQLQMLKSLPAQSKVDVFLKFNTGMNRLGFFDHEAATLAAELDQDHDIALVMSHFACSEEDHPLNALQVARFRAVRGHFPGIPGSLANCSGIFLVPSSHHDLVRPGVALYGANPLPGRPNPMQPVVSLHGRIVQTRDIPAGATVGYSATWTARRPTRLAVVSVGYADGFLRGASASDIKTGADAIVAGQRCPLAGRVSMDLIVVDVTDVEETRVSRGDLVTLLGEGIGVDDLAARAGTIGYEVLTSLGRRYRRVYRS